MALPPRPLSPVVILCLLISDTALTLSPPIYTTEIYCPKLDSLGYVFVADIDGSIALVNLTQLSPKATVLSEITRNDGHWHGRTSAEKVEGTPPFPPLPPFSSLPLDVGPLNPARGLGSAVSFPSRVSKLNLVHFSLKI